MTLNAAFQKYSVRDISNSMPNATFPVCCMRQFRMLQRLLVDRRALVLPRSGCRIRGSNIMLESSDTAFDHILTFRSSPPEANIPASRGFHEMLVTQSSLFEPLP